MADSTLWWLLTGAAVAVELLTGTFYLLMLAIGLGAAALAAHAGASMAVQLALAALVGGGAVVGWHVMRLRRPGELPAALNRDVNLDIGERVHVTAWSADRTTRVQYRGSGWTARLAPGAAAVAGEHTVSAVEGNWLVLSPSTPAV